MDFLFFKSGKDLVGQPWWSLNLASGYQIIAKCRYCLHSDCNWLNTILGHPVDSKSGLIHFWASNLLDALFIPYRERGERR